MTPTDAASLFARFRGAVGTFRLDAAFEVPMCGVSALFGPSGCGKTTVLRCIAGLHHIADGHLSIGGETWQDADRFQPTSERSIGYVFQEASLFPHLSVRQNLLYGHRRALRRGTSETIRFDDVIDLLGLAALLNRAPLHLSGGERQRVAIGRALLSQPQLLLMDEPLAGLDRLSKDEILPYLETLPAELALPVLYVSHDLAEIERLADHLVLMEAGRVLASGPLRDLQTDASLPVTRLPEASVVLEATVVGFDPAYELTAFALAGAPLGQPLLLPGRPGITGSTLRIRIRASDLSLAREPPGPSTILNIFPARVVSAEAHDPAQVNVVIRLGSTGAGERLLARVTRKSWETLAVRPGDPVYAQVKGVALLATGSQRKGERRRDLTSSAKKPQIPRWFSRAISCWI